MPNNRMKINLSEYASLEEKSECFLKSDKYENNCIRTFDEFDNWFSYWEGVNQRRKYKVYFRGMSEAVSNTQAFKNPIYLSVDEWGAFGRNFMSILPVAQSFNSFIRHADVVKMGNFTMLTGLLSSDPKKGTFKSPLFYIFKAYSNNCLGSAVDTYVDCDTFNTEKYKGIPYLDVTTTYSKETNTVFINVVNRHKDKAITADIINTSGDFAGNAESSLINSKDLQEGFTFDKQNEYIPVKTAIDTKNNKLTCTFPPHSFTQLKISVKGK
ncbi:alpha-L-arabinofuranosidase C-terminal domain-containing protein [Ferruginibacter sp. SUN106]|uniref:alpha-L-arabinofuranosidase C-terminal domain-containing protein n=1 Tax=Ferruginibacter sp. SUN106 TaxID=2978348 RepID=UPI003D36DE5B